MTKIKPRPQMAWAVVDKYSGKVLTDFHRGHLAIYKTQQEAEDDRPGYGKVVRVRITTVVKGGKS